MPTRIVLKTAAPSRFSVDRQNNNIRHRNGLSDESGDVNDMSLGDPLSNSERAAITRAAGGAGRKQSRFFRATSSTATTARRGKNGGPTGANASGPRYRSSKTVFRSSILKELSVRNDDDEDDDISIDPQIVRFSSNDIRASPRLLGYLFATIASAVMLASVVQFYLRGAFEQQTRNSITVFVSETGTSVYVWKLWGAIGIASGGILFNLLTCIVHFDNLLFQATWVRIFRDGSRAERNWIIILICYWAVGIHVCTSTLSVGEGQANVYFTTWIAFAATANNMSVWRESAGLPDIFERLGQFNRETTYNWLWTLLFSLIFSGAMTDLYFNRDVVKLQYEGIPIQITSVQWSIVLSIVWAEVGVCFLALILNYYLSESLEIPCICCVKSHRCLFGWPQFEGPIILVALAGKLYVILEYTGVDGVINGLSNSYFGIWLSFFSSVFAMGAWLKANRSVSLLVNVSNKEEKETDDWADVSLKEGKAASV